MRTAIRAGAQTVLVLSTLLHASDGRAGPADDVFTPMVEEGERELELKAGLAKLKDGTRVRAESLGIGYGVTSWWSAEVAAIWHKEPGERHGFDAWELENRFQLTQPGRFPVDVGLLLEIERPKDRSEGYEYRWGPLLQSDLTPSVQANLNLLFEKRIRSSEPSRAEFGYQWQVKYRWQPAFEYGLQGFGNVGPWKNWESRKDQPHIAGPAVFGRFKLGDQQVVKYNAGILFGLTSGAPRTTFRLQAEYEF